MTATRTGVAAAALMGAAGSAFAQGVFLGSTRSTGVAMSGNGAVIIGSEGTWYRRVNNSDSDMPVVPGAQAGVATAVNWNGSVVVGHNYFPGVNSQAAQWVQRVGTSLLPLPPGLGTVTYSEATAVNGAGNVIAGYALTAGPTRTLVRWVDGVAQALPSLTLGGLTYNPMMDGSGSMIVGTNAASQPFVWTEGGTVTLPTAGVNGAVEAVSSDGNVIAGFTYTNTAVRTPVRWIHEADGWTMHAMGTPAPGTGLFRAYDTNGDGSIVVGTWSFGGHTYPMVWTQDYGYLYLSRILEQLGITPQSWTLDTILGISDDGRTLFGEGRNFTIPATRDWMVTSLQFAIPSPSGLGLLVLSGLAGLRRRRG
ncbi:MAG: hypothetical protein QM783_11505 [Phycisphaerales bacterium]